MFEDTGFPAVLFHVISLAVLNPSFLVHIGSKTFLLPSPSPSVHPHHLLPGVSLPVVSLILPFAPSLTTWGKQGIWETPVGSPQFPLQNSVEGGFWFGIISFLSYLSLSSSLSTPCSEDHSGQHNVP